MEGSLNIFDHHDAYKHIFTMDKEKAWEKTKSRHGKMFGFMILLVIGLCVFVASVGSLSFLAMIIFRKWYVLTQSLFYDVNPVDKIAKKTV